MILFNMYSLDIEILGNKDDLNSLFLFYYFIFSLSIYIVFKNKNQYK